MGKKNKANALGRSLIKDRFGHTPRRTVGDNETMVILDNKFIVLFF